jgi:O-antigen/teichoic acid export membrane protein
VSPINKSRLVRISGVNYGLAFLIDFCVTVFIARLLTPAEIGTFSVAMASIVLIQIARTAGVNLYIVQARELGPQQIAAALGLAVLASTILGALVVVLSGPIAAFYRAPAMQDVLRISALGFLFVPIQSVASGLLMRELRVYAVAVANLSGSAVGGCVTLFLAWHGIGPTSLAIGALANVLVAASIGAWAVRQVIFVRPSLTGWQGVLSISGWLVAASAVGQMGVRLNELVVGRSLGLDQAAMLDRAEMLPRMVWSYIAPALLGILTPLIASELRTGADARGLLIERMRYFSLIFVPVMVGMSTQGESLILTVFGAQWVDSIPSVFWLCLNGAIAGQAIVIASVLIALGRTREAFLLIVCEQGTRAVVLLALAHTDITTIARGMVLVGIAYAGAAVGTAVRAGIMQLRDLPSAVGPSLIAGAVAWVVGTSWKAIEGRWLDVTPAASLISAMLILAAAWLISAWVLEPRLVRFGLRVAFGK